MESKTISKSDCRFPKRDEDAHKGQSGRLLLVGGSIEFVGAPILAAMAAFRSGVDIVYVAAPSKVAFAINQSLPSIITHKLRCSAFSPRMVGRVLALAKDVDAVLLGNGLGRGRGELAFVRELVGKLDKPLVVDADALHAININCVRSDRYVLTPHAGEFAALLESSGCVEDDIPNLLNHKGVVLRKGKVDRIMSGERELRNETGVPQMAVAGTGDVLAGLVGGFLAQGLSSEQAAINAAFVNGKAGEEAAEAFGNFTAEELINFLRWDDG